MTMCALFFLALQVNGQDECAIYKIIIEKYVLKQSPPNIDYTKKTTLTILEHPNYMNSLSMNDYERLKGKYKKLDKQTVLNFIDKAQEELRFQGVDIENIELVLLARDSVSLYADLASKYPYWSYSTLELSNIGFNKERNQAFVYYGYTKGVNSGGGVYIIFEKKRNKWKQKGVIPVWAG